jgi:hypothetical protein
MEEYVVFCAMRGGGGDSGGIKSFSAIIIIVLKT